MFKNVVKGRKLAWYRNESIRFDVDSIAIENDINLINR